MVNKVRELSVAVIIPTMCTSARADLLERAIDSVFFNKELLIQVIVVVNGDKFDKDLVHKLMNDDRLLILKQVAANVSMARLFGLSHSNSEYFCFLDDDDEFLPNGLMLRASYLHGHPEIDVVVTNGIMHQGDSSVPFINEDEYKDINVEFALSHMNWFASPASMFRAKSVDREFFNFNLKYFEWTYLLLLLVENKRKIQYVAHKTFIKYENNKDSVSKSIEYAKAYPDFLLSLGVIKLPSKIRKILDKKYINALHGLSEIYLHEGNRKDAWLTHLKCIKKGGWSYLLYTRHLISSLM